MTAPLIGITTSRGQNKEKLPYPSIPPYPTEKDIIDRAQILLGFLI